jgi:Protein kinase domain
MSGIGPYEVVGVIGSGGFGTVYLCTDPRNGDRVAAKVLDRGAAQDPVFLDRVHAEATAMRQVADEHCVRVRDVVIEPGVAAIVTDLVEGASLRAVLDRYGRLTGPQAVDVLRGALRGLVAVHRAGLLHGDIKPDNILVDRHGVSRLIDFGLAAAPPALGVRSAGLTGSPGYLSPEQIRREPADVRSDVYACAVMLFELLAGRRPYGGTDTQAVLDAHLHAPVPDPRAADPSISPAFAALCVRGLAKDPTARPASAADFLLQLEDAAAEQYGRAWRTGLGLGALVGGAAATGTEAARAASSIGGPARSALRAGRRISGRAVAATGAVAAAAAATAVALSSGGGIANSALSGHCSDPHPSYTALTFAGVVCIHSVSRVHQADGSTEYAVHLSVTNKDPNTFGVRSWDFQILDTAGHDVDAEDAHASGRTGVGRCVYQTLADDGWPVKPGATFTMPGPLCFNLGAGERPSQLVWQGDVSVTIPPR